MDIFLTLAYLFFIGSVLGWVLELLFRNLTHRREKLVNPGFCTGPYLPIYGFGLCVLFLLASLEEFSLISDPFWNKVSLFLAMAVGMTLIEQFKPSGHAFLGGQSQSMVLLGKVLILRKIPPVLMVLFADNVLF